jgi:hypothetical protein
MHLKNIPVPHAAALYKLITFTDIARDRDREKEMSENRPFQRVNFLLIISYLV